MSDAESRSAPAIQSLVRIITMYPLSATGTSQQIEPWVVSTGTATVVAAEGLVPALAAIPNASASAYLMYVSGVATALTLDVRGVPDDFLTVVQVVKELFDPDVSVHVGTRTLTESFEVANADRGVAYPHQIVLFPAQSRTLQQTSLGGSPLTREQALRQLVFKDTDIRYDAERAPITEPEDIAAALPLRVSVWATMTVTEGLEEVLDTQFADGRLSQMVDVNAQILAARLGASAIRTNVMRTLMQEVRESDLESSEQRLVRLRELRRELVSEVKVIQSGVAVRGGRPIASYHRALMLETSLTENVQATEHLLDDLLRLNELDRSHELMKESNEQARQTTELLNTSNAIRVVGTVFATVSIALSVAGLVSALAAVPADRSATWARGVPRGVVWGAGTLAVALFLGLILAALGAVTPRAPWRTVSRIVGVACAGGSVWLALLLWRDQIGLLAFPAFVVLVCGAATSIAYSIDFNRKKA